MRAGFLNFVYALLALVAPMVIALAVSQHAASAATPLISISVGVSAGLVAGALIGAKFGRLSDYLLGPAVGGLVGYLDLHAVRWLCGDLRWPIAIVDLLPIWGLGIGIWAAMSRFGWIRTPAVIVVVTLVDFLSRVTWITLTYNLEIIPTIHILLGSLVYCLPAAASVLLAARRRVR